MRDKLRQLDETYLDLMIGILLGGVLSAILGMIITRGDLRYLIGAVVGLIAAWTYCGNDFCSRDDHNDDGKHPEVCTDGYSSGKPEYDQECVDKICSDIGYFICDDQT